ncbi:MAG: hypothetical protein OT477_00960 [Chloroflexi bacterium]|nr:hypothetical protein [Chloroflexota bacterium]
MIKVSNTISYKLLGKHLGAIDFSITPFNESLTSRRLLFPFDLHDKFVDQLPVLKTIASLAQEGGETELYVVPMFNKLYIDEITGEVTSNQKYYQIPLVRLDDYFENEDIQYADRFVFTKTCLLVLTFEEYGLLGTTPQMLEKIEERLPDISSLYQPQLFLDYWKSWEQRNGVNIQWAYKLLEHLSEFDK